MKLAPIFFAMLPALAVFASQAEVYQVVELGPIEGYKSSFSAGINNNNQTVGTVSNQFNYPIDLSAIDYESSFITGNLSAADIEEVKKGNVNSATLSVLKGYLQNSSDDYTVQRFVDAFAVRFDSRQQIKLRETNTPQTNFEYLVDINDNGAILGYASAPYTKQSFTPAATDTVPNPITRQIWVPEDGYLLGMVVNNGNRHKLQPLYTKFGGGYSVPRALTNSGRIVGNGSVGLNSDYTEEAMAANCLGDLSPKALCFNSIIGAVSPYRITGLTWQLDNNGVPGVATELGFLGDKKTGLAHTRTDYPAIAYNSSPSDVNDAGIAVGVSVYSDSDTIRYNPYTYREEVFAVTQATIFNGSELSMITDVKEWESSRAYSINNKNVIVGAARKVWYQGPDRFFVYDFNAKKLTFPTDLFSTATTVPAAINENNQVVGTTESFTEGSSVRRSTAFWYDLNTGVFNDLNKLLPCNSGYTLISAQDINDKNVIVATATKKVDARDHKGDIVKDSAGNPIKEEVAVAVQLLPVANGAVSNCSSTADEGYSRQGGSIGFGWLSLLLLPLLRRRLR